MNYHTYVVEFWYNTDLRCEARVEASNEVEALILARKEFCMTGSWIDLNAPQFYIRIRRIPAAT